MAMGSCVRNDISLANGSHVIHTGDDVLANGDKGPCVKDDIILANGDNVLA